MKRNYTKMLFLNTPILIGVLITFTSHAQFITKWNITGSNETITIPTTGSGYNYIVNWGDGNLNVGQTGNASHTYLLPGTYQVSITGTFPRIYFNDTAASKDKIIEISQWGTNAWESMRGAFGGCISLNITATDAPVLSGVTDMSLMFYGCEKLNPTGAAATALNSWHTGAVKNMDSTFYEATVFNQDIGNWNTTNVKGMDAMFFEATAFNKDIGPWNTANVTDMNAMFEGATSFNQDIGHWNTGNVANMAGMFAGATAFNRDIGHWNTANVTDMSYMFQEATTFNQDIDNWNTAKVTDMRYMFSWSTTFNGDIGHWNVAEVTNMHHMFLEATTFNRDIGHWNTANVTDMAYMFSSATAFNQNIGNWNTARVTDMYAMFWYATAFNQDIGHWNTANVTNMGVMFISATSFNQNLGNWKMGHLFNLSHMLDNSGLSVANYDRTLIGWAAQAPPALQGLDFGAGGLKYCTGADARSKLISTYGLTIYGDSLSCILPLEPKIFPNPTTGPIRIINLEIGDVILLTNVIGQKLLQQFPTDQTQMLDIHLMAQGIYLISIIRNNKIVITKKITKLN